MEVVHCLLRVCGTGLQRTVESAQHIKSTSALLSTNRLVGYIEARLVLTLHLFFFSTSNSTTLQTSSDGFCVSSIQEILCQNHNRPYAKSKLLMRNSLRMQIFGMTMLFVTVQLKKRVLTSYFILATKTSLSTSQGTKFP